MEYRKLGKSNLDVSLVGLGCNNFGVRTDLEGTRRVVDAALDLGITFFDTSDSYGNMGGSETCLGEVMGARRQKIVLATKFGSPMDKEGKLQGASRAYVMSAVEASLKRLKTDWIDLYQLHRPDPATLIEETLRALDDLVSQGKIRYIGNSNFSAAQVDEAQAVSDKNGLAAFVCCQNELSLLVRGVEKELVPAMQRHGLGFLPYFPLAGGLLTGKYRRDKMPEGARLSYMKDLADRYVTDANWQVIDQLVAFCEKHGRSMLELSFSWLAARPTVASVIAGATRPEQLVQNAKAVGWRLTPEEIAEIDRITARG